MNTPWCKYFDICNHKYVEGTEHLESTDYLECPTFPSSETCKYYKDFKDGLEEVIDDSKSNL